MTRIKFVLCVFLCLPAAAGDRLSNWPQWRGPEGRGVSLEKDLPTEWSSTKNIAWKTAIPGRGHSSPIVWGNRIFLTTSIEGPVVEGAKSVVHIRGGKAWLHPDSVGADHLQTLKVLSIDADSGKILWERTAYEGTVYDNRHRKSSYASPTAVTDGESVIAFFGAEGVYSYDFSGKLLWKASVGKLATLGLSTGSSPVLYKNLVILQCDQDEGEGSFITALDKKTGKEVWRVSRHVKVTWATPVLIEGRGRTELVAHGYETITSYDPATGKELWHAPGVMSNAVPSPVFGHGLVFLVTGYPAKRTFAIRLGGTGEVAWKYEKGTAYVSSPILYGDYLYLMSDSGILTCVDAKTGEVKYDGGRVPVAAKFSSSPVAYEGKILLSSEDGDTFVIKAGPEHEVLRTNSISEPIYASPAIAGGKIYIRGAQNLYCIH